MQLKNRLSGIGGHYSQAKNRVQRVVMSEDLWRRVRGGECQRKTTVEAGKKHRVRGRDRETARRSIVEPHNRGPQYHRQ